MKTLLLVCTLAAVTAACGGDDSPTAPTPQLPNVTGNYTGTTTIAFPELRTQQTCSATTSVTQSGTTVNIAPIQLGPPCSVSLPFGQGSIDNTGAILGQNTGQFRDSCGLYSFIGSGGFFGRELRLSFTYTSITCYNMNITINLSR